MSRIPALRYLQQMDTRLAEIEVLLTRLDDGSRLREEIEQVEGKLKANEERARMVRREMRDRELELGSVEEKIRQLQQRSQSGQVRSPREVERLEKESESLRRQKDGLEDKILAMMDEVEAADKQSLEMRLLLEQNKQKLIAVEREYIQTKNQLTTEREQLLQSRAAQVQSMEEELVQRYESIRKRNNNLAVVAVIEGNICGGCRVSLTGSTRRHLLNEESIPICENCGRILYLEETEEEGEEG